MSELRSVIRAVLTEELRKLRQESPASRSREEMVSIRNNSELATFVKRMLTMAQDARVRADIESGRHVFRLAAQQTVPINAHEPLAPAPGSAPGPVRFENGLIGEKQVAQLPDGLKSLSIGKSVRFTPLARDELRRRGVKIEG